MARRTPTARAATAAVVTVREVVTAALVSALIALATIATARADDVSARVPTAQNASIPPASRDTDKSDEAAIEREYLIKAAILFNFAKFASWPEAIFRDPASPLTVCVLGTDPFGAALDTLSGKQVRNRPLVVARIAAVEDARQCQILFVSASEEPWLAEILAHLGKLPILTVADMDRFAAAGGVIGLKEVDNRSRIEVNIYASEQAGVTLSSKLLRLADTVGTRAASSQP